MVPPDLSLPFVGPASTPWLVRGAAESSAVPTRTGTRPRLDPWLSALSGPRLRPLARPLAPPPSPAQPQKGPRAGPRQDRVPALQTQWEARARLSGLIAYCSLPCRVLQFCPHTLSGTNP